MCRQPTGFGPGPESDPRTVRTPAAIDPPGAPTALAASVVPLGVTVTWGAPTSGGAPSSYVLLAGAAPGFTTPLASVPLPASPNTVSFSGVPPGTYYLRLHAQNAGGTSAPSAEVSFTIAPTLPPAAPTMNTPSVSGNTISLSWSSGGGGTPTYYVLTATLTPSGPALANINLSGTNVSIPGVPSGTYFLRLTAVNASGASTASNQVTLVVP